MKKLLIILLTTVSFYATALPDSAKQDMYLLGLSDALKEKDYKDALTYIEKLDSLNLKLPNVVNYYRGEALFHTKKYIDANAYLTKYIETSGAKGKHYKSALGLLLKAEPIIKRYTAYSNGTVTDNKTGLMWMRCALGQTWNGATCVGEAKEYDWHTAKNLTANFAGYDDWQLPTIKELHTLIYCSNGKQLKFVYDTRNGEGCGDVRDDYQRPTINQIAFPNAPSGFFWSSSSYNEYNAWIIAFFAGRTLEQSYTLNEEVRLVRRDEQ